MQAAGVDPKAGGDTSDLAICQDVAYRITQREYGNAAAVFAVVEELLTDEDNYDFVISFLEDVQNLVSHHLSTLCAPEDITPWLGQRCTVCWATLARFWDSVSAWCSQTGVTLEPSDELLSVQNEKLRALLWTANRLGNQRSTRGRPRPNRFVTRPTVWRTGHEVSTPPAASSFQAPIQLTGSVTSSSTATVAGCCCKTPNARVMRGR